MSYFNKLPNILYQSPLPNKQSTGDLIEIKNIFRRSKLYDYLKDNVSLFNKYVIRDGERPDTIAESVPPHKEICQKASATNRAQKLVGSRAAGGPPSDYHSWRRATGVDYVALDPPINFESHRDGLHGVLSVATCGVAG